MNRNPPAPFQQCPDGAITSFFRQKLDDSQWAGIHPENERPRLISGIP